MDDLLDKKTLGEYIRAYQSFKREQEQQKKKEEEMLERFYGKSKKKKRESSFDVAMDLLPLKRLVLP